jgi:hypothetical protein
LALLEIVKKEMEGGKTIKYSLPLDHLSATYIFLLISTPSQKKLRPYAVCSALPKRAAKDLINHVIHLQIQDL